MHNYLSNIKKVMTIMLLTLLVAVAGCGKGYPDAGEIFYQPSDRIDTKDTLLDTLKANPNEIQTEDTLVSYIYNDCTYLDYKGVMTYYMVEDKVLYSRWETKADSADEGKQIYQTFYDNFEKNYTKQSEETQGLSMTSVWSTENGTQKTLTYLESDTEFTVAIRDME